MTLVKNFFCSFTGPLTYRLRNVWLVYYSVSGRRQCAIFNKVIPAVGAAADSGVCCRHLDSHPGTETDPDGRLNMIYPWLCEYINIIIQLRIGAVLRGQHGNQGSETQSEHSILPSFPSPFFFLSPVFSIFPSSFFLPSFCLIYSVFLLLISPPLFLFFLFLYLSFFS